MEKTERLRTWALFGYPEHSVAWEYLSAFDYPWEALDGIAELVRRLGERLPESEWTRLGEDVWISKSARVASSASVQGPAIIGARSELRQGAYVRGAVLVGEDCVVGNSVELKNCILFDGVQVPHFNYVGDSILGYRAHMGAGAVTSNVKSDKTPVCIRVGEERIETGRKKLGAMLGDYVEVGCNSVLNPGSIVGKNTSIYPLSSVRGVVPENTICKNGKIVKKNQ